MIYSHIFDRGLHVLLLSTDNLVSVSAGSSASAAGGYGATAERGVAHELLWHLAVDGRIFLIRCHLNRADQQKIKGMQYQLTQAQNILPHHPRRRFFFLHRACCLAPGRHRNDQACLRGVKSS